MVEVVHFDEKHFDGDGFFVSVNREEAMRIIETLSKQIVNNRCNGVGRAEFYKVTEKDVQFFTIAVNEEEEEIETWKYPINEIWSAEDAIEASDTEVKT